jgi:hypothetical protein
MCLDVFKALSVPAVVAVFLAGLRTPGRHFRHRSERQQSRILSFHISSSGAQHSPSLLDFVGYELRWQFSSFVGEKLQYSLLFTTRLHALLLVLLLGPSPSYSCVSRWGRFTRRTSYSIVSRGYDPEFAYRYASRSPQLGHRRDGVLSKPADHACVISRSE